MLALPSRQFMGIATGMGGTESHETQQVEHLFLDLLTGVPACNAVWFGDGAEHLFLRIEGTVGVLKDHAQL